MSPPTSNSGGLVPLFSVICAHGARVRRSRVVRGCVLVTRGRGSVLWRQCYVMCFRFCG